MDLPNKKTVYYDGTCPMCTVVLKSVNGSSQKEKFDSRDINAGQLPQNIKLADALREIHVVDQNGKIYKNVEAILKILEEYPRYKVLSKIGRLPIIKQFLQIGYKVVAVNRYFIFGSGSRIFWLKVVLGASLISGLLLSHRLWFGTRYFPPSPVFINIFPLPVIFGTLLFSALVILLVLIIFSPKPKKFILSVLVISVIFIFFDQSRLQPWFYQYFFMLGALAFFSWDKHDLEKRNYTLNICRLIIGSIYFYSGLHKINPFFILNSFPWMVGPIVHLLPTGLKFFPLIFGPLVPFIEMGIGIGLLTKKYRKAAIILALVMMGFVLFTIGPWGLSWNSVVWPWNIAMVLFVLILFWKVEYFAFKDILWAKKFPFQKVVLILFTIMPIFSFFGVWDSYPSFNLYSGNVNNAEIYISDAVKDKLPLVIQKYASEVEINKNNLNFTKWSLEELNIPVYPEPRVYKDITRGICKYTDKENDVTLVIKGKPTAFYIKPLVYNCSEL